MTTSTQWWLFYFMLFYHICLCLSFWFYVGNLGDSVHLRSPQDTDGGDSVETVMVHHVGNVILYFHFFPSVSSSFKQLSSGRIVVLRVTKWANIYIYIYIYFQLRENVSNHKLVCVPHLFDSTHRGHMVDLSTPLVVAVVLSPVRHVPQILTSPEVLMLVADPSVKHREYKSDMTWTKMVKEVNESGDLGRSEK